MSRDVRHAAAQVLQPVRGVVRPIKDIDVIVVLFRAEELKEDADGLVSARAGNVPQALCPIIVGVGEVNVTLVPVERDALPAAWIAVIFALRALAGAAGRDRLNMLGI